MAARRRRARPRVCVCVCVCLCARVRVCVSFAHSTIGAAVSTLAGGFNSGSSGTIGFFADGTGILAAFNFPLGVAVDASGNVLVADTANHVIRRVTPNGGTTRNIQASSRLFVWVPLTDRFFELPLFCVSGYDVGR